MARCAIKLYRVFSLKLGLPRDFLVRVRGGEVPLPIQLCQTMLSDSGSVSESNRIGRESQEISSASRQIATRRLDSFLALADVTVSKHFSARQRRSRSETCIHVLLLPNGHAHTRTSRLSNRSFRGVGLQALSKLLTWKRFRPWSGWPSFKRWVLMQMK